MSDTTPLVAVDELHHIYLVCLDVRRTVRFYQRVLGLQVRAEFAVAGEAADRVQGVAGARGLAVWGRVPGCPLRFELVQWTVPEVVADAEPRPVRPGPQMLSFAVADAADVAAALRADGHPVDGPLDMPDGSRLVLTRDPDGTTLEFVQLSRR